MFVEGDHMYLTNEVGPMSEVESLWKANIVLIKGGAYLNEKYKVQKMNYVLTFVRTPSIYGLLGISADTYV